MGRVGRCIVPYIKVVSDHFSCVVYLDFLQVPVAGVSGRVGRSIDCHVSKM